LLTRLPGGRYLQAAIVRNASASSPRDISRWTTAPTIDERNRATASA